MIHTASYLQRRSSGVYYFRIRIPIEFQQVFGSEVRISLRTGNKTEAARLSRILAGRYHERFIQTPEHIVALIPDKSIIGQLQVDFHPDGSVKGLHADPTVPGDNDTLLEALKILRGTQQVYQAAPPAATLSSEKTLGSAIELFLKRMAEIDQATQKEPRGWDTAKAKLERPAHLAVLLDLVGNVPVSTINSDLIDDAWKRLQILPPNWKKSREWREKPIDQIITAQIARIKKYDEAMRAVSKSERHTVNRESFIKSLSASTCNNYAWTWSDFFGWCKRQRFIDENYAADLALSRDKTRSFRRGFKVDELRQLFESEFFIRHRYEDPYQFWIPLLLLYSGSRLNEMGQLLVEDIVTVDDVPCILIWDDEVSRQRLKNDASRRRIPIHSKILEAGFLSYVDTIRNSGALKLFPRLDNGSEKHGKLAGNWWNRFMVAEGVKDGKGLDAHSFRHTAIGLWKNTSIDERWAAAICGQRHLDSEKPSTNAVTYDIYGGLPDPKTLQPYVEMLDFGLTHPMFKMPTASRRLLVRK